LSDPFRLFTLASSPSTTTPAVALNLAWVIAGGCMALLAAAGMWTLSPTPRQASGMATRLLCVMLAALSFFATGFALAMGSAGGTHASLGPLAALDREWAPYGAHRGLLGLDGFFLSGAAYDAGVYALFALQAALLILASVIALVPWADRAPRLAAALYSILFGGLLYPVFANWVWGSGWLSHLGEASLLGHGTVDFAGSGVVCAAAGLSALGASLALPRRQSDDDHASDATIVGGLFLAVAGWIGLVCAHTYSVADGRFAIAAANVVAAVVTAAALGLLYTWFAAGEPDLVIGAFTGVGGLAAVAAGAPFYPAWAATLVGAVAALLVLLAGYVFARLLRCRRTGLLIAAHSLGGLWGLAAVGLMADGSYGAGWNGIGERMYLGVAGQGVTGRFPAGPVSADPSQLGAQAVAMAALLGFLVLSWLLVALLSWATRGRQPALDGQTQS
jgi:Amt family ammonium transporter